MFEWGTWGGGLTYGLGGRLGSCAWLHWFPRGVVEGAGIGQRRTWRPAAIKACEGEPLHVESHTERPYPRPHPKRNHLPLLVAPLANSELDLDQPADEERTPDHHMKKVSGGSVCSRGVVQVVDPESGSYLKE